MTAHELVLCGSVDSVELAVGQEHVTSSDTTQEANAEKTSRTKCDQCRAYFPQYIKFVSHVGFAVAMLYLLCLLSMIHPSVFEAVREHISGHTSQPPRTVYSESCALTLKNIVSGFDIFLLFHFLGNMWLCLSLRSRAFAWVNSIMWEAVETTYNYVSVFNMTTYRECWYDIIFFDVLTCNALGIEAGIFILKHVVKVYPLRTDWSTVFKGLCVECDCGSKRLVIAMSLILLPSCVSLFSFAFWEYTLWVTVHHPLQVLRCIVLFLSIVGVYSQLHDWVISAETKSDFKNTRWILVVWSIVALEFAFTVRHYVSL